jgi:hypothetical protein
MEKNGLILVDEPCKGPFPHSRKLATFPVWQRLTCQIASVDEYHAQAEKAGIRQDKWLPKAIEETQFCLGAEIEFTVVTKIRSCSNPFCDDADAKHPTTEVELNLHHQYGLIGSYLNPKDHGLVLCPSWLGPQLRISYDCQPEEKLVVVTKELTWWLERLDDVKLRLHEYGLYARKLERSYHGYAPFSDYKGASFVLARKSDGREVQ